MIEVKDIGELNERIVIFTHTRGQSTTTGESVNRFTSLGTFWAKITFLSETESGGDNLAYSVSKIAAVIRYNSSVTDLSVFTWSSKTYNIRGIEHDDKKMYMKLIADYAK